MESEPKQELDPPPGIHRDFVDRDDRLSGMPSRFLRYISQLRTASDRIRLNMYPDLSSHPWHDSERFDVARDLEQHASEIIAEARALDERLFTDEGERIGRVGRWSVVFLYERGRKNLENSRICPKTTAVIEAHRSVTTMAGLVYFSRLDPGTRVTAHRGPTNMRLRCHFGIDVPEGCAIRVADMTRTWSPGRCIVFDDSFEHEVWNLGAQPRTVLIVDIWHPDLTDDEVLLLDGLQRYAAGQRRQLTEYWALSQEARASQASQ